MISTVKKRERRNGNIYRSLILYSFVRTHAVGFSSTLCAVVCALDDLFDYIHSFYLIYTHKCSLLFCVIKVGYVSLWRRHVCSLKGNVCCYWARQLEAFHVHTAVHECRHQHNEHCFQPRLLHSRLHWLPCAASPQNSGKQFQEFLATNQSQEVFTHDCQFPVVRRLEVARLLCALLLPLPHS